ncbi:thermonuclease family protein [Rhizobium sp. FY34]|uniref:thermonuclease family protein n=1 Tax=Rhizobium sp. FY34 TaxID=2562309 RepID=UPI0010C14EB7|nr:thermonuclease family protein [Rhizobium sp. FY34]
MSKAYRHHRRMRLSKDLGLTLCFLFLLALVAARLGGDGEETVFVGPFRVVDGDTLAVGSQRLRLIGIDAPELAQACRHKDGQEWACGEAARASLARLIAGGALECRGFSTDRYHRLLVGCFSNGQNIGALMVREGLALATGAITFRREQASAQAARAGIWVGEFEHPREWRSRMGLMNAEEDKEGLWHSMRNFLSLNWL